MRTKKERPERSTIHVDDAQKMKCWAHRLGVSPEELREVVREGWKRGNGGSRGISEIGGRRGAWSATEALLRRFPTAD
jgi:hypothetical protein